MILLYTSVDCQQAAQDLAQQALNAGYAACVQIQSIDSWFCWQGQTTHQPEWRLLFKTTAQCQQPLIDLLIKHHPYQIPAIFTLAATPHHQEFCQWLTDSVSP